MLIQSSGRMVNSVDVEHQRSEEFMDPLGVRCCCKR